MNMKTMLCVATAALSSAVMASVTPEVSNVAMTQSDYGRRVTITYELSNAANGAVVTLDIETNKTGSATNVDSDWVSIGGAAVCNAQGAVWRKVTSAEVDGNGKYTITWRPDHSWEGHKVELANGGARAVVTAWALDNTPDYMVVDVSDGAQPNTQRYYPAVDFLPGGLFANQNYRTTKLVMRKIMAKGVEWTMGSTPLETMRQDWREATHQVTLTNNYYIGVFEVTQAQWDLVQPNRLAPSKFNNPSYRAMRPVENVCYNELRLRGNSAPATADQIAGNSWPKDPNPSSFLWLLRTKSGIDFDLPGDAQWEFAARAGNGDTKWGDGSAILNSDEDENLAKQGRYERNGGTVLDGSSYVKPDYACGTEHGTTIVGSCLPNAWGLYDMHGNVWEWCNDWHMGDIRAFGGKVNIDPSNPGNPLSGSNDGTRIIRGGDWSSTAGYCRSASRSRSDPTGRGDHLGFRLVCTAGLQ